MQSRKPNHHKNQQKSVRKNNKVQGETNDECEHQEWLEQHQTNVKAAPALFKHHAQFLEGHCDG
jgi:hypothetical protein